MNWEPSQEFSDELRVRYVGRAMDADHGKSKTSAIVLYCRECMQQQSAADCTSRKCFLFPFRPGADAKNANVRQDGDVPPLEWYQEKMKAMDPDGSKAEAMRARATAMHEAKRGQLDDLGELV